MLDAQIAERTRALIHAGRPSRTAGIDREVSRVLGQMNARGVLRSSMTINAVREVVTTELQARANVTLGALLRVHGALGAPLSEALAADLKREASIYINEDARDLTARMVRSLQWYDDRGRLSLEDERVTAQNRVNAEIDLYADSLKVHTPVGGIGPQTVHVHGPVGALQMGPGSVAHVIQQIGPGERDVILEALEQIKARLPDATDVDDPTKQEIQALVDESEQELRKDRPVLAKVRAMLRDAAATIQTIASLQPAYQTLKAALVPLGIYLP